MQPIYSTGVLPLSSDSFLYIQSKNIFNCFFILARKISVHSSRKCQQIYLMIFFNTCSHNLRSFLQKMSTDIFNDFFILARKISVYSSRKCQQIYLMIFLILARKISVYSSRKCHMYCLKLPFLVHKIFTFYIRGVLKFKCPAPRPKGKPESGQQLITELGD